MLVEQHPVDAGANPNGACGVAVEPGVQAQVGACVVDVAAQHPATVDSHWSGRVDPHWPPQTAGVPRRVHRVPVLEDAGDGPFRLATALRRARHLDGQHVLGGETRQAGDVEAVREEVALRIAEVGAVEPHVGLVEHPLQGDEVPPPFRRRVEVEPLAIDQGVVVVGERGEVAPMAGDVDHRPVVVVVVEPDRTAPSLVIGNIGAPLSRQIHDGEVRRGSPRAGDPKNDMVDPWQHELTPSPI